MSRGAASVTVLHAHTPPRGNLPTPLTSFVGRSHEIAELHNLLARARLVTLTGAGGCGKSRLALRAATDAIDEFPEGAWWVELALVRDADLVGAVLAQVFDVRPRPGQSELEAVVSHLAPRRALVVLDNCEHLLDEAARAAEALARGCPHVRVVATSREPLRAEGEIEWRVPSLSLPIHDADTSDAVRLFVERAGQVRSGFCLTAQNAAAVASICRQLDGIPLAIELAAARLRAFSIEQIAGGLADRFGFLSGGTRTALPRHQRLQASVDWSHDLLSNEERVVFRRLGVFMGGFTLEAAESVCAGAGVEPDEVLGLVVALVEKSLVQAEERGPVVRYRLLETVRQYALERLDAAGEIEPSRDGHRDFYLELAERIAPDLLTPRMPQLLDVLDPEAANLALAIERAAATEPEKALRLVVAITLWWRFRGLFAQGEAGLVRALEAATATSQLRAQALWSRAFLLTFAGATEAAFLAAQQALEAAEEAGDDSTTARALCLIGMAVRWFDPIGCRPGLERARDLAAASGDEFGLMHVIQALGISYVFQDDHLRAKPFLEEALPMAARLGQPDVVTWHWVLTAMSDWVAGDRAAATEASGQALAVSRQAGDVVTETAAVLVRSFLDIDAGQPQRAIDELLAVRERALAKGGLFHVPVVGGVIGVALAVDGQLVKARSALEAAIAEGVGGWAWGVAFLQAFLAEVARLLGDARGAQATAQAGLDIATRIGDLPLVAGAQLELGRLAAARGEWAEAQRLHHEALPVSAERGFPRLPHMLEALAEVAAGLESYGEAARLLGAAKRHRSELGIVPWPHLRLEIEALEARVRTALGPKDFEQAFTGGTALTADEVVAYVRRARGRRKRPPTGWESLTPTELEVARHTAAGLTNAEIAERMFIATVTVRTHLTHIFTKLGLKNRAGLAREVARRTDALDI